MIRTVLILISLVLVRGSTAHAADPLVDAPFGLQWGMSKSSAEGLGIKLQTVKSESGTNAFSAEGLPKVLGDVASVRVDFGYADKLRRIVSVSRPFTNDPYGSAVLARYNELFQILESKYGHGKTAYKMGDSIYAEQRYFLAGIHGGQSWHYANFEANGVAVELSVRANDSDTGVWVLIYEDTAHAKEFEKEKKDREKNSL